MSEWLERCTEYSLAFGFGTSCAFICSVSATLFASFGRLMIDYDLEDYIS